MPQCKQQLSIQKCVTEFYPGYLSSDLNKTFSFLKEYYDMYIHVCMIYLYLLKRNISVK